MHLLKGKVLSYTDSAPGRERPVGHSGGLILRVDLEPSLGYVLLRLLPDAAVKMSFLSVGENSSPSGNLVPKKNLLLGRLARTSSRLPRDQTHSLVDAGLEIGHASLRVSTIGSPVRLTWRIPPVNFCNEFLHHFWVLQKLDDCKELCVCGSLTSCGQQNYTLILDIRGAELRAGRVVTDIDKMLEKVLMFDSSRLLAALVNNVKCELLDVGISLGQKRDVFDPTDELHHGRDLHPSFQTRWERVASILDNVKATTKGSNPNGVNSQAVDKVLKIDDSTLGRVVAKLVEMRNTSINTRFHERLQTTDIAYTKHGR